MLSRFSKACKSMYSRTLGRMGDREKMAVIGGVIGASFISSVLAVTSVHFETNKAVSLALGDKDIAKQIYLEANKDSSFNKAIEKLAEYGTVVMGGKTGDDLIESYIQLHSENYFERASNINFTAKNIDEHIDKAFKVSKTLYDNESLNNASNTINAEKIKQAYKNNLNENLGLGLVIKTVAEKNIEKAKAENPEVMSKNEFVSKLSIDLSDKEKEKLYESYKNIKTNNEAPEIKKEQIQEQQQDFGIHR